MKVKNHINRATIEVDFSSEESAQHAIEFIAYHAGLDSNYEDGCMNKIALIKAVRQYALECVEKSLKGDERPAGLASAKQFVEQNLARWYRKKEHL